MAKGEIKVNKPSYEYLLNRCGELEKENLQLVKLAKEYEKYELSLCSIISAKNAEIYNRRLN